MSRPRRLMRLGAATVLCFGLALQVQGSAVRPASAQAADVTLERSWQPFAGKTTVSHSRLALDAARREGYVIWQDGNAKGPVHVRLWGLDSLQPRGAALDIVTTSLLGPDTPVATDSARGLLAVALTPAQTAVPSVSLFAHSGQGLRRLPDIATRFPQGYSVRGLAVDAAHSRLLLAAEPVVGSVSDLAGVGSYGVQVDSWRLDDLARGVVRSDLSQPVPLRQTCGQLVMTQFAAGVTTSADGTKLFIGCVSNRGLITLLGPNAGDVSGVVEVDLRAAAQGSTNVALIRPIAGDFARGESLAWPGVPRLVMLANGTSSTFKVFDTAHRRYVGNVGIDGLGSEAFGLDSRSGRAYYLVDGGLGVFDPLATPVSQGTLHSELAGMLGRFVRPFDVDPTTGRVFAITSLVGDGSAPYVAVLHGAAPDGVSAVEGVATGGLDVAEVPGKTESSRTADGAAMGAELRMVGGPSNLLLNTTHFDSRGVVAKPGTRVEQFGVVRGSRLTNDEASVTAVTSRQDDATASDANNTQLAVPLTCVDFGGRPIHLTADSLDVSCDLNKQQVSASVSASMPRMLVTGPSVGQNGVPAAVQVRSASSSVTETRAASGAGEVRLDSSADGIDILGVVQIGRVTAHAVITSHGRHGTAKVSYTRSVSGVVVAGTRLCSTECPFAQVTAAIDQALAGRGRVEFPDAEITQAKSGQESDFVDDPYRHLERVLFDDVPDDSVLSPALEVVVYADETTPSRLDVSLAALSGRQIYQIFPLDQVTFGPPPVTGPGVHGGVGTTGGDLADAVRLIGPSDRPLVAPPTTPETLFGQVVSGLRFGLRSLHELFPVAALWMLLALPIYLSARRRLLLWLPYLQPEETK